MATKLLSNLSYAKSVPTYVSPPLSYLHDTAVAQEEKYFKNLDSANLLEAKLSNVKVDMKNIQLKNNAIEQLNEALKSVRETKDWANASGLVRESAQRIATDSGLKTAIMSRMKREKSEAALAELVGKPPEEGGITQEDYLYEVQNAKNNDPGVQFHEGMNMWKDNYKLKTPPAYYDKGKEAVTFIDGWKSNQTIGGMQKSEDGNFYKVLVETTPDGAINYIRTTEKASFTEIYAATRNHLNQNQRIAERDKYEAERANISYQKFVDSGITRKAMVTQLTRLNKESGVNYSGMEDEELAKTFYEETKTFNEISGAVEKYAYINEDIKIVGKTFATMLATSRKKNAGSDEQVLIHTKAAQFLVEGYSASNVPKNLEDYNDNVNVFDESIAGDKKAMEFIQQRLTNLQKDPENNKEQIEIETNKLRRHQIAINEADVRKDEYNFYLNEAIKEANADLGTIVNTSSFKELQDLNYKYSAPYERVKAAIEDNRGLISARESAMSGKFGPIYTSKRVIGDAQTDEFVKILSDEGKLTKEDVDAYNVYSNLRKQISGGQAGVDERFMDLVNTKMKEKAAKRTTNYGFVNIANDIAGKRSDFSNLQTQLFKDSPNNYQVIDKDTGQAVALDDSDSDIKLSTNDVTIIGVTTEYIPGHGYLLVANEDIKTKNKDTGKITIKSRQVLLKPNSNDFMLSATRELHKADYLVKNQIKKGYNANSISDFEQAWALTAIDDKLSFFSNISIETPKQAGKNTEFNEVSKTINVNSKYTAKVTRRVDSSGNVDWIVTASDEEIDPNTGTKGPTDTKNYSSYFKVEQALEELAGTGYKVPLSYLETINDYTFQNGRLKVPNNGSVVTYLNKDFLSAMRDFDAVIPYKFVVTDMMRSQINNKELVNKGDAAKDSYHGYGAGIDLRYNPSIESWLTNNSDVVENSAYRKIKGQNLKYLIHGADKHIHIEFSTIPESVKENAKNNLFYWPNAELDLKPMNPSPIH